MNSSVSLASTLPLALGLILLLGVPADGRGDPGPSTPPSPSGAATADVTSSVTPSRAPGVPRKVAQVDRATDRISLVETPQGMVLEVADPQGNVLFWSEALGPDPRLLPLESGSAPLVLHDVTGDGEPEILVGTSDTPGSGLLHVFTREDDGAGYSLIPYEISAEIGSRDYLVWDAQDAAVAPLELLPDGRLKLPGRIFDATGTQPPQVVRFVYGYQEGRLLLLGKE